MKEQNTIKGSFENPYSLIEACEVGSESAAREVEKILGQRDELLAACKDVIEAVDNKGSVGLADRHEELRAAIKHVEEENNEQRS